VPAMLRLFQSRSTSTSISAFLALAVLTSLSGFFLPFSSVTPAVAIGIVALLILALVLFAQRKAQGSLLWRLVFAGGVVASLYLLVFVGLVQAFMRIGPLHAAAPTQSEPPFVVTQAVALIVFVGLGVLAALSFQPKPASAGSPLR